MKKVNILDIAEYLALRFELEGIPLSPLKLQKLLYYIQAWHLVFFEKNLIFEELPEAWVNGPVYRTVYNHYSKKYKLGDIIKQEVSDNELQDKASEKFANLSLSEEQAKYLEAIISKYGFRLSAEELVYLTHVEDPWNDARQGLGDFERSTKRISVDSMYNYYQSKRKIKQ